MAKKISCLLIFVYLAVPSIYAKVYQEAKQEGFAGSVRCRSCHEKFYKLWAPSYHGLAMQPYTPEFSKQNLTPQKEAISINKSHYKAEIEPGMGWVVETSEHAKKKYPIEHVLGGKNVYYFLTSLERGRLQTLPVAYDVNKKQWFDTAASGVRHFPGQEASQQIDWKDPLYTFNTSCYGCHVSQLTTNYDLKTDTYNTKWAEPGINCETCHGPSEEHVKVCQEAPEGQPPKDMKIISTNNFTADQINAMCSSCHAKQISLSTSFTPGDRYFDHFDLVTLEHSDYYPDGGDLGENYTYTSWLMSPCVKSGKLDCMHCHTSSGRYRFKEPSKANNACLPCHEQRVEQAAEHTHHPTESEGKKCIDCHMPMTQFARMNRTDHSMLPPTPATTIAFQSPNACNLCHKDKDAAWADKQVRQWHKNDYQDSVLRVAGLVDGARKQNWKQLDSMLDYIGTKDRDEVFATSLIRLLSGCSSDKKWPVIIKALQEDRSPLVRAAAAEGLNGYLTGASLEALLKGTSDEFRLVRVRAAASLAAARPDMLKDKSLRKSLVKATDEFKEIMNARPDDYTSHFNLGNFYMDRGEHKPAISAFMTSHRLRPDSILPLNNIAFAYNAIGQNDRAEENMRKALAIEPENAGTNLNLAMLLGEMNRISEAEKAFRNVLLHDPNSAVAMYNLGIILAPTKPKESILWCSKAYKLRPENGNYGYTYAFYLHQNGDTEEAVKVLRGMVNLQVPYADAYALLGAIYLRSGDIEKAIDIYRSAKDNKRLSESERNGFGEILRRLDND
jgi:Flp pilus assembly protein TadD